MLDRLRPMFISFSLAKAKSFFGRAIRAICFIWWAKGR